MKDAYYYRYGEAQYGPIPRAELERLIAAGQLTRATPVWGDGMAGWAPASHLPGPVADEGGIQFLIPTARTSRYSLAAGYLGLFGIVVFPLAPFAILLGILGIRDLKRNPEKNGWGRAITGVVLGGLTTLGALVVLALVLFSKK